MSTKKTITVFGATGIQGGSVIKWLLTDPKTAAQYHIRAVTRETSKPAAQKLIEQGVEVVFGDLDKPESLSPVLKDSHSVFLVTSFWETRDPEIEIAQGKACADAAKNSGVQFFIYSSLLDVNKLTGGKLSQVYHFDSKAKVEEYIRSIGLTAAFFLPGSYMSNFPGQVISLSPQTGAYTLAMPIPPTSQMPLLDAAADTGKFVKAMLLNQSKVEGKRVLGAIKYYSLEELIQDFKNVKPAAGAVGGGATAIQIPDEVYKNFMAMTGAPPVIQEELLQMLQLMADGGFGYYGGESLDFSHSILEEPLTSWSEFVAKESLWAELN